MNAASANPDAAGRCAGRAGRFVVIDPGSNTLKLLHGRNAGEGPRVMERRRLSVREGGAALEPAEIRRELQRALKNFGDSPICLCLPQRLALSQVVDLPGAEGREIRRAIESEIAKLSGLNESQLAFDYAPMKPFGRHRNPYWVTFCQEDELRGQITRLGLEMDEICEITTAGNALLATVGLAGAAAENVAIVDLGAGDTTLTLLHEGQAVYAGSFPIGGDAFTDAVVSATGTSIADAELERLEKNLASGGAALPALQGAIDEWRREIERIVEEWRREHGVEDAAFEMLLYTGPAPMPGLLERLNSESAFRWSAGGGALNPGFEIAQGAGVVATGESPQSASLIPSEARAAWKKVWGVRRFQAANFVALFASVVILAFGSFQKREGINARRTLLAGQSAALARTRDARALEREAIGRYNALRPALERQRSSLDTLETLAALEASSADRGVWYALFADTETYVSMPEIALTNAVEGATNAQGVAPEPAASAATPAVEVAGEEPDGGFIAVATVPGEMEAVRATVGRLVEDLNRNPLFAHVDLLSADRRRMLVDPKVVVPDRHFVISIRMEENVFREPVSSGAADDDIQRELETAGEKRNRFRSRLEAAGTGESGESNAAAPGED